ncbi:MAG: hypothetical protein NZ765_10805 [Anaerolineae bacterium]|nr:hypothetical protein [Anaerolineae bacterium]MDW8072066.1 hypothetical protein [Anaerolineae bacterium]
MRLLPIIHLEQCTGCECCVACCPTQALEMRDGKAFLAYPERCDYEARCEEVCPVGAIELPYHIVLGASEEDFRGRSHPGDGVSGQEAG